MADEASGAQDFSTPGCGESPGMKDRTLHPPSATQVSGEMDKPLISCRLVDSDGSLAETPSEAPKVGILGSGDFARSLVTRLVGSGFSVVVGSRNPKRTAGLFPSAAQVTFQAEAVDSPDVIFVAMFREHYSSLCGLSDQLAGKILVDVPICSDHPEAKRAVSEMVQAMGFMPVDMGSLVSAREVEAMPLRLLPGWKVPALLALGLFIFFYIYNFVRDVLQPYVRDGKSKFYKLPVSVVNTTLPCVAYVLLSLVYLPGVLAAALQLHRGTKYRRFPDWLDHWLQHRKQIGLLSFFCAALHALYSFCLPLGRVNRYEVVNLAIKQVLANKSHLWIEEEVWRMEIYLSLGVLALGTLSQLAVTSLPSIANSLNWREFSFVQSTLGFVALVLSTLHTLTYGWTRAFEDSHYKFYLPPTFTLTLLVPCVVILAKGLFLLPCFRRKLSRIRRGWEKDGGVKFALPADHTLAQKTSHV
ncbi:metalloreductase STEAP3 isoform X2 [Mustela lutreola]|uniref:metalloreductase STEAP3 isoform X2 n=1 Tax=Mustela lutreola TaxID=9666 RepID=UPI0027972468|nr:metalloreductase STEAP3 isoform X2 [Mustela lutreola]